jgi:murein DD-endopeptidase MepM/ murein hydrolase activator NlpD
MIPSRLWTVAIVAFAVAWVAAGIVTSRAIATFAGGLDAEVLLAGRDLALPIAAGRPTPLRGAANALAIAAPRGTAVVATDSGRVMRFVKGAEGGVTVYQADSGNDVVYTYAHLERIADGLREGAAVKRGDVIGYVGGEQASVLGPHLRFEILRMPQDKQWTNATAINPLPYYIKAKAPTAIAASSVVR